MTKTEEMNQSTQNDTPFSNPDVPEVYQQTKVNDTLYVKRSIDGKYVVIRDGPIGFSNYDTHTLVVRVTDLAAFIAALQKEADQ